ncbi:MAG: endonuclease domain-containing protein [Chitinispirillaceae bacterium]|nr:endonuclease domain-containing protein [Chitinispirillaceae bacterium]
MTKNIPKCSLSSGVVFLQAVSKEKKDFSRRLRKEPTPAERLLWEHVRNNAISDVKFRRQQVIDGYVVDFFCHNAKLVIEVDGKIHNTVKQKAKDIQRKNVFEARGLMEIRFRNEEVLENVLKVVKTLNQIVDSRIVG